jgi:hypothetical protein
MTEIMFSALKLGITIQRDDGSIICSGTFEGASIKSAIPLADGARCILLLDPDASSASAFENLMCIDRAGDLIWRALANESRRFRFSRSGVRRPSG